MKRLYFLFFMCSFLLFSCKERKPKIDVHSPNEGQVFVPGEIVAVKADIYDDGDCLLGKHLLVTTENRDTVLKYDDQEFTGGKYELSRRFVTDSNTNYKIEIYATGGHGHTEYKTVFISTIPKSDRITTP